MQRPQTSPGAHRQAPASTHSLLQWLNNVLALNVDRLEQLGTGAVACQLVDAFKANSMSIQKVNFFATEEHEVLQNWKQFQAAMEPAQLPVREVDVARLSKGAPAENLELLQWMHRQLAGLAPVEGYNPEARRALSVRGGTSCIPVPKACRHSSFNCYGSAKTSPRTPPVGSAAKHPMTHVSSKYKANFAPPCLSPRGANVTTPVPILITHSPRSTRSARPTTSVAGDTGPTLHVVNLEGHQVLAVGYVHTECRATQTDELALEQWQQLVTANSRGSDVQPVAMAPSPTDELHTVDVRAVPGPAPVEVLVRSSSRAIDSLLASEHEVLPEHEVVAAAAVTEKIGKAPDDDMGSTRAVDWRIAALEAYASNASTGTSTPRGPESVPGARADTHLLAVGHAHSSHDDDALSSTSHDSTRHVLQFEAGAMMPHCQTTTEEGSPQVVSNDGSTSYGKPAAVGQPQAHNTTRLSDGPISTDDHEVYHGRVSIHSELSDPPVDGQLDSEQLDSGPHTSGHSLRDNEYAASLASGVHPGSSDEDEDEDTLDRAVSETHRSRSLSAFSSLARRDSGDISSMMPRVRSRLMHCQVAPGGSSAGAVSSGRDLGAWEQASDDSSSCEPESSKLSAYQNVYSTDAEGMVHVERLQSHAAPQAHAYVYSSGGAHSSDDEEQDRPAATFGPDAKQHTGCADDAPASSAVEQNQLGSVDTSRGHVTADGVVVGGVFITSEGSSRDAVSCSGSHKSSASQETSYLRDDLSHASTHPQPSMHSTAIGVAGDAVPSLINSAQDALQATLLTQPHIGTAVEPGIQGGDTHIAMFQTGQQPTAAEGKEADGLAPTAQADDDGVPTTDELASQHSISEDEVQAAQQGGAAGVRVDSDGLTDPEDEQAYSEESPGHKDLKAKTRQWNVFSVNPDDSHPGSTLFSHLGHHELESRPVSVSYSHLAVHQMPHFLNLRSGSETDAEKPDGSERSESESSWMAPRPSQLRYPSTLHVLQEHDDNEAELGNDQPSEGILEQEAGGYTTASSAAARSTTPSTDAGMDAAALTHQAEAALSGGAASQGANSIGAGSQEDGLVDERAAAAGAPHGLQTPEDSMIFSTAVEEDAQVILHEESQAVDPDDFLQDCVEDHVSAASYPGAGTSASGSAVGLVHSHEALGMDVFTTRPVPDNAAGQLVITSDNEDEVGPVNHAHAPPAAVLDGVRTAASDDGDNGQVVSAAYEVSSPNHVDDTISAPIAPSSAGSMDDRLPDAPTGLDAEVELVEPRLATHPSQPASDGSIAEVAVDTLGTGIGSLQCSSEHSTASNSDRAGSNKAEQLEAHISTYDDFPGQDTSDGSDDESVAKDNVAEPAYESAAPQVCTLPRADDVLHADTLDEPASSEMGDDAAAEEPEATSSSAVQEPTVQLHEADAEQAEQQSDDEVSVAADAPSDADVERAQPASAGITHATSHWAQPLASTPTEHTVSGDEAGDEKQVEAVSSLEHHVASTCVDSSNRVLERGSEGGSPVSLNHDNGTVPYTAVVPSVPRGAQYVAASPIEVAGTVLEAAAGCDVNGGSEQHVGQDTAVTTLMPVTTHRLLMQPGRDASAPSVDDPAGNLAGLNPESCEEDQHAGVAVPIISNRATNLPSTAQTAQDPSCTSIKVEPLQMVHVVVPTQACHMAEHVQSDESEGYDDNDFESEEQLQEGCQAQGTDTSSGSTPATSSAGASTQGQEVAAHHDTAQASTGYEFEAQEEQQASESDAGSDESDAGVASGVQQDGRAAAVSAGGTFGGRDSSSPSQGGTASGSGGSEAGSGGSEAGSGGSEAGSGGSEAGSGGSEAGSGGSEAGSGGSEAGSGGSEAGSGGSEAGRRASRSLCATMSQQSSSSIHDVVSGQASEYEEAPAPRLPSDHQADFALPDNHAVAQPISSTTQLSPGSPPHHDGRVFKMGDYQYRKLRNGDVFKGRRVRSRKEGPGVYVFVNGDVYEGDFEADLMSGHGVYTFSQEGRYEGGWQSATYHGAGMETFSHGSKYCGQYHLGLRSGWGTCSFFNGDYYEGQWFNGLRHGWGLQQCSDSSSYVGAYLHGKRHGQGLYTFPNGDQYAGEYKEDLPNGFGVYMFANGQMYKGKWLDGRKNGWSTFCVEGGTLWAAYWQEGKATWVESMAALETRLLLEKPDTVLARAGNSSTGLSASDGEVDTPVNVSSMKAEVQLQAARRAQAAAEQVADLVKEKAMAHDNEEGDMQQALSTAVQAAQKAAASAQNARMEALFIAQSLDSAMTLASSPGALHVSSPRTTS